MTAGDHFQLLPAAGVAAVMAWWGVLQARVVQLGHRAGAAAAWRQPSRPPRQHLPVVTVTAAPCWGGAALHRPLAPPQPIQLRRQRPGAVLQVLQVAVAVEGSAVDAAGPAAGVTGLWGAGTGVVGPRPAAAPAALIHPRAGRDADLPGPARPAAHEPSPPWPGHQAPTNPPSRRARPSRSRMAPPPYSPDRRPTGARSGAAGARRPNGRRTLYRGTPNRLWWAAQQGSAW